MLIWGAKMATDKEIRFIALCMIDAKRSDFDYLFHMNSDGALFSERNEIVSKDGGVLLVDTTGNYVMNAYWYGCDDSTRPLLIQTGDELAKEAELDTITIHLSSDDLAKIEMLIDCYEL